WILQKEVSLAKFSEGIDRVPHYCSGCPHNTSTRVPEGSRAMAGIGCHYMATWMPDRATKTFTQMGGEGATWIGQAPFTSTEHVFQNLGDGTYFHSGILAIRATVAAGVNITYKILYNDAVAMTGGQPIDGTLRIEDLIYQIRGEGIKRIALVSDEPAKWHNQFQSIPGFSLHYRDEMNALQKQLRQIKGVSVLIYDQVCAAEKRRRRKKGLLEDPSKRVFIHPDICEGCGDCGVQSNCLSVLPLETELGRKRQIDQSACNKDFSCVKGFCPSFVTVLGGQLKKQKLDLSGSDRFFENLPEPALPSLHKPWNTVITGIGGTGVLTVGSLIAMAAHIEGKGCATLNQTGLAQKFGAVVCHVRIAQRRREINAVRIPAGEADLLLGCDLVVSSGYEAMSKVSIERSHAVINAAEVPTSAFILNPDMRFPQQAMQNEIKTEVGADNAWFIDSSRIATALLGDSIASNLFMLGYAWQSGLVPVSAEAIEKAIAMNGVAVDFNCQAFLWGRRYANQPDKVLSLIEKEKTVKQKSLDEIIEDRVSRLIDYQNQAYADKYREQIEAIRAIDSEAFSLTSAVAKNLYKLMAYKDEYEVARLFCQNDFLDEISNRFEGDFELKFNLAPPLLNRMDKNTARPIKREYGGWMMKVFPMLSALKGLRGSAFDIFAHTLERKLERADIDNYLKMLEKIKGGLTKEN
ncbi:MAG: indolepyruvate ferredoxin oxidoreductase family protein, partial [Gammaproteobacteria bacterium]|nr:indolepyruvate ferredoxin oxidoreductase family protein [Gammaproteobacteria bacterium]